MRRYKTTGGDVYVYGIPLRTAARMHTIRVDPYYLEPGQSTLFTRRIWDYGTINLDIAIVERYFQYCYRIVDILKKSHGDIEAVDICVRNAWQLINYHAHTIQLFLRRVVRTMAAKRTFDFLVNTHSDYRYLHDALAMQNVLSFLL